MNDALARSQDFSEAKNRKKRLTASTKKPSQDVDVLNQLQSKEEAPLPGHRL